MTYYATHWQILTSSLFLLLTYLLPCLLSIFCAGAKIYLACRSLDRAQHAVDDIVKQTGVSRSQLPIMQLNLASFKSIRSFASAFRESKQSVGWICLFFIILHFLRFLHCFDTVGWATGMTCSLQHFCCSSSIRFCL